MTTKKTKAPAAPATKIVTGLPVVANCPPLADWLERMSARQIWRMSDGAHVIEGWRINGSEVVIKLWRSHERVSWDLYTNRADTIDAAVTLADAEARLGLQSKPATPRQRTPGGLDVIAALSGEAKLARETSLYGALKRIDDDQTVRDATRDEALASYRHDKRNPNHPRPGQIAIVDGGTRDYYVDDSNARWRGEDLEHGNDRGGS